jgi:L-malate glycosyltransferase
MPTPTICFVGPMIGMHPGCVTTQDEILAGLFCKAGYRVFSLSHKRGRLARLVDTVAGILRSQEDIDVFCISVYGGLSFVNEDIASLLATLFKRPVIFHLHGGALPDFLTRHPLWGARVLSRGKALIAPSQYLQRSIRAGSGPTSIIPNVVDLQGYTFRLRQRVRPRLLWMRTFHEIWNPRMALRVMGRLRNDGIDARLVMGGQDKGMLGRLRAQAETMGIAGAVSFPGFLDAGAKVRYGDECDIFINTNRVDNTPVALIEAWAMGLPVVSTNVGGIPDLVRDGETGLLVDSDDDAAMAWKIKDLLQNVALARQLSESGRRKAETCSWENVRPQWEDLLVRVMLV